MGLFEERRTIAKQYTAEIILAALLLEGRSKIQIPLEQIEDECFRDLVITVSEDFDTQARTVKLSFRSKNLQELVDRKRGHSEFVEYEIVTEPTALPKSPKQLSSGENTD